ncbi:DUF3899 domain-containing protein [Sporolactobacillus terrae]|uniref:DUF3899 domain-containing protein n=1 Tax=Sporolactobacillus terrae TaxID=269673 RepID=A0A410D7Q9_9BACL|nr:DUF3899 domain-containing protein [Sporolactobacillus terrae]QAA22158.1 DUF3899 domain-containing protein [Sporolactobacillus terrae]QAA25131.1 DUF3899 domain-containing protein [Sporolactobacillus terrae]UAK16950.1 DUF3899 domain-containing protein [Sporolactobacillus terrae]BBN98461.1 hypothetical protein St703_11660 [Sporolactobacillus terrae]
MSKFRFKIKNLYLFFLFVEILISIVTQGLFARAFSLITLINHLSVVSLLSLNLGLIIFIIQGGFFDGMTYSFKRVARAIRKKQLGQQEAEAEAPLAEMKHRDGSQRWPITWPLILSSLLLFVTTVLISLAF